MIILLLEVGMNLSSLRPDLRPLFAVALAALGAVLLVESAIGILPAEIAGVPTWLFVFFAFALAMKAVCDHLIFTVAPRRVAAMRRQVAPKPTGSTVRD
jgi:hypothetical protein